MPPNSTMDSIMINSVVDHREMLEKSETITSAATEIADASAEKQPIVPPEEEMPKEEKPERSDGNGEGEENAEPVKPDDEGCVDPATAAEEEDAGDVDCVSPQPQLQRRASNEEKIKLHNSKLLDSTTSQDSWGGPEGSLPAIADTPDLRELTLNRVASVPTTCGEFASLGVKNERCTPEAQDIDDDHAVNYINFNKLLEPSSSEYYYSEANRSNRQKLEKIKSKKKVARGKSLDESGHSRISLVSENCRRSSYRGPMPMMKNGSRPKSIAKFSSTMSLLSIESPTPEDVDEPKVKERIKRCSFSSVDIREHERVAGDNPCVTSGVPLSIGWGYLQHEPISLDDYEEHKGPARDKIEMMVPAKVRRSMLRDEFGVSIPEINASMKEVNITKKQRRHTVATENMEGWVEVAQSAKRKFKRFMKKTSTAKEEEKIWDEARKSAMADYLKAHGSGSLGKNPNAAGVGRISHGPKVSPGNGEEAPPIEISFQNGEGEGGAPSF